MDKYEEAAKGFVQGNLASLGERITYYFNAFKGGISPINYMTIVSEILQDAFRWYEDKYLAEALHAAVMIEREKRAVALEALDGELITASRAAEIIGVSVSEIIEMRRKLREKETCEPINIIFDAPPGPHSGAFVEVETDDGKSINVGEWIERPDGYWALRIASLPRRIVEKEGK